MITEKQVFIDRYMSLIWNTKDLSVVRQIFDEDAIIHSTLGSSSGVAAMEEALKQWQKAFPDMHLLILEVFEQNDRIAVQWQACGTHQGVFLGVEPSLLPVKCDGTSIYRLKAGKVIEYWAYVNIHHILQQINFEKCCNHQLALL